MVLKVTHKQLNILVKEHFKSRLPLMVYGGFGIGKSFVIRDSARIVIGCPFHLNKEVCNEAIDSHIYKQIGDCVAFDSGFGDGVYEVFAKTKDFGEKGKRICEVKIKLIDEEDNLQKGL